MNHCEDNRRHPGASNPIDERSSKGELSLVQAERECRQIATRHYENFVVASVFLPRAMRQPFFNVYAFCRHADDLADCSPSRAIATERLLNWRGQLADCFAGEATHPIFVALRAMIEPFTLSRKPFDDLISAFLQDQKKTRYETFDELLEYCRRSADPVGRIVLRLADSDQNENLVLSDSISTGLQLANHWQDLARDFASGRIYLPREDAEKYGIDLERLDESSQENAVRELIHYECDRGEQFLRQGLPLAARVPRWLANDIRLFVHGGLATIEQIRKINYDVMRIRPTVSRWRQFSLMTAALLGRLD